MAATISASGTWTGLTFNTTKAAQTRSNVPTINDVNLSAIADADYPELEQFITLFAAAHSIGWQRAKTLIHHLMTAANNRESPNVATTRVYTP